MKEIIPPTNCPSCSSELREVNFQLFCRNSACPAQGMKIVENFCKVMKYKGLGPETILKAGYTDISDILSLVENDSSLRKVVGDKIADKVVGIIRDSRRTATLPQIIQALGIPLIGKVASEKIAKAVKNVESLMIDNLPEEAIKWGLTEKVLENLLDWWYYNNHLLQHFAKFFKIEEAKEEENKEYRGVVCITGKLNSFKTKKEGYDYASSLGFKVVENFNKTVTHLINESGKETSTTLKAKQNNTTIVIDIFKLEEV